MNNEIKLLFPDCLFDVRDISLSLFLYFQEKPIYFTLHPTVSLFNTGCDPFKFYDLVAQSEYEWKESFLLIFKLWRDSQDKLFETYNLLRPLQERGYFKTTWLVYSRSEKAIKKNKELIKSTGLEQKDLLAVINIAMASQELISHILFEKFLEFYQNKNMTLNNIAEDIRDENLDYKKLMNYCDKLFKSNSIEELLISTYFFRLNSLEYFPNILLSNEKLINFLTHLPPPNEGNNNESYYDKIDVIAWEIFRQLTSKYLETKEPQKGIEIIINLRENRSKEIFNLKNKCLKLAEQFKGEIDLRNMVKNISKHIEINTEKEIRELLDINKQQYGDLFNEMFADEKTWLALGTFIISYIAGGPLITAGSALAGIANVGAKAFKIASKNEEKIKTSDYSLIYTMKNLN